VPRRFRLDTERQIRRLNDRGHFVVSACEEVTSVQDALAELFRMKIAQRRAEGEVSFFEDAAFRSFEREIGTAFLAKGWLFAHVMRLGGQVLAANFGFTMDKRVYCHLIAYDIEFDQRFSPGRLLQYFELKKSFETGMKELDFAWDRTFYKTRWCNAERETTRLYLFKRRATLQKLYLRHARPALKRAYLGFLSAGARNRLKRFLRLDP
jgi:CelD/BcsL family acetyltransferase involved in cellulose biosynthesis